MASVFERQLKDGSMSFGVLFREGTKQRSKVFAEEKSRDDFRVMVERHGATKALKWLATETDERPTLTVEDLADKWFATKTNLTPAVVRDYTRFQRDWIKPRLGHMDARALDADDVQAFIDDITPKRSAKECAEIHALLHQMYTWGGSRQGKHIVDHDPCTETVLPARGKTAPKGLRIPELVALLDAQNHVVDEDGEPDLKARAELQDAAEFTAFLAGTSWRISEAIALTNSAVELVPIQQDDGSLKMAVYVTMEQVHRKGVGIVQDAKSEASFGKRLRVLGPGADAVMRRYDRSKPNDYVFTFRDGRPGNRGQKRWNATSYRERRLPKLIKAAGLEHRKPTPHWLRHTHVALCIAAGMDLTEIQRRLGHEDLKTTLKIYGRVLEEMKQDTADALDALMRPQPVVIEGKEVEAAHGPLTLVKAEDDSPQAMLLAAIKDGQISLAEVAGALALAAQG